MAYSQNDPTWKNTPLGFDSPDPGNPNYGTIGMYGCYVTAIANVCSWAGNNLSPAQINDLCREHDWFIKGDLINNDGIPALLCGNLQFVGKTRWTGPTSMDFFADASDPNVVYIIEIDASHAPGIQTHFVMVWATHGSDLVIDDSWDGVRKNLSHYGDPATIIQSATKFIKVDHPPAPIPVVEVVAPAPPPPAPYVPPATPIVVTLAQKYTISTTIMTFGSSQDAIFHKDAKGTVAPGDYYQFDTQDSAVQLGTDNMKALYWVNTKDNVAPAAEPQPEPDPAITITPTTADWKTTFTPFPDGKSRRYVAQRDLYLYDLAATDAKGINITKDEMVPIYGSVQKGAITYLVPRLSDDTLVDQVTPKTHWYGIPTTSVYTGLPSMKSQQYIDALKVAEAENRVYRKSVHHETADDRLYYAEQLIARAVSNGVKFLDVISLKKVTAYLRGQKVNTKK